MEMLLTVLLVLMIPGLLTYLRPDSSHTDSQRIDA